jgi:transcription-repair coupling factor (superfamily II helicase)
VFAQRSHIDPLALVQLVQQDNRAYKLQGSHRLRFRGDYAVVEQRFRAVESLLERLAPDQSTGNNEARNA